MTFERAYHLVAIVVWIVVGIQAVVVVWPLNALLSSCIGFAFANVVMRHIEEGWLA